MRRHHSLFPMLWEQVVQDAHRHVGNLRDEPETIRPRRGTQHDDLALGGSPRASLALFRTSQALAAIRGRNYVEPDDVKRVAVPVLNHRLIVRPESRLRKVTAMDVVDDILGEVPVPTLATEPNVP